MRALGLMLWCYHWCSDVGDCRELSLLSSLAVYQAPAQNFHVLLPSSEIFWFLFVSFLFMRMCILPAYVSVYHANTVPAESRRGFWSA